MLRGYEESPTNNTDQSSADAAEVVLEADDVVLTEVLAVLHLDEHEVGGAGVLDAVRRTLFDVDRDPGPAFELLVVQRDDAMPAHDEPVLGTARVLLVAEPLPRQHDDLLHLVIGRIDQNLVAPPRTNVALQTHSDSLPFPEASGGTERNT